MSVVFIENVTDSKLKNNLIRDLKRKWIASEHWFTNNVQELKKLYAPDKFKLGGSTYTVPSGEKKILEDNKKDIFNKIKEDTLVFWGAGRKEAWMVNNLYSVNKLKSVVIIDVEKSYVEEMIDLIKPEIRDKLKIYGLIDFFQSVSTIKELIRNRLNISSCFHVCLGTTIGNFNKDEILSVFKEIAEGKEEFLIGLQLEKDPDKILEEYSKDENFTNVIAIPELKELEDNNIGKSYWDYDREENAVKFWFEFLENYELKVLDEIITFKKGDKIEIFRSKKYILDDFKNMLEKHSFKILNNFKYKDHCLLLIEKN